MPKVRVVAPTSNPKTGELLPAGAEVDLDDESYALLRQEGKVEASQAEQKASATPEAQGNYDAKTSRADTATTTPPAEEPKKK